MAEKAVKSLMFQKSRRPTMGTRANLRRDWKCVICFVPPGDNVLLSFSVKTKGKEVEASHGSSNEWRTKCWTSELAVGMDTGSVIRSPEWLPSFRPALGGGGPERWNLRFASFLCSLVAEGEGIRVGS